jgi:rfaE bifunctional protein nucleotidyltransferase chain/domain
MTNSRRNKRGGRQGKVYSVAELIPMRRKLKRRGKTVVFTNGCFDLLHAGHIRLFRQARRLGDVLIVALNDDRSVRKIKGPARPIFPLEERWEILAAIEEVDYLTSFSEETPRKIIAALVPDVLVKGGDWGPDQIVGREEVEAAGGKVVIVPYLKGSSTSSTIAKIKRLESRKRNKSSADSRIPGKSRHRSRRQ